MALVGLHERTHAAVCRSQPPFGCSLTEVSFVLHDLSWTTDGPQTRNETELENEVMVDTWSSMDSSNSPLTDSGPSASDDCNPSTSSEPPRGSLDAFSPVSPQTSQLLDPKDVDKNKTGQKSHSRPTDKTRPRDLEIAPLVTDTSKPRRPHFLDDDYQPPSRSNIECKILKPHFLDHSPSPDELDEKITNANFLDDDILEGDDSQAQKKGGALPKRSQKPSPSSSREERPRTSYRSTLHYGLESAARSSERDKRASQLYRGTWPGERDVWTGHDSASVRSFSSNGSAEAPRTSTNLENKMECVYSLLSLLTLSPDNNADLSGPLLDMSRSVESCIAMRQAGCIPLLVQLIHSKLPRETRDRAAKALRNIIHTQTDDKAGRREARVWRLLEQVREYCYILEDLVESRKEGKESLEDDATKHPSQSVAALMKLSFDEEHRHVVCQLGGLQALAALVSGDQAAHGSRTDDNTCLTMRKYAGMTLTNLTFGDGNNKSLLCSFKDFMMALVEQLESPNDDMRQVTAAVLRNLSWRADTNSKQVLREVGAVKGLTKAAMTCQKEATLKSVLSALWNLTAHCSMNKVALCSVDGALGFLVDMLSYNSPTKTLAIVENAGGIMRNVSSHIAVREDYRQILRERNCLSVLLQHLKSPSLTVVSNSCGTLWNLSARCPQDQQFLWDHGAVPMLRSLIHSKHKMIAMGSSAALKNLLNSKPGKTHIISLDSTARNMNLPALPTLGARKQKALEQELDQNLAETCDNIEPATSPSTSNREEKNLFTATERQIAMNLERHRMTSSSPLMGALSSQISLSHSAHLASYLSCSNTLLKGALVSRSTTGGSSNNVNRSESKDSVTSTHSDTVFEKVMRTGKVPIPTPRNKVMMKTDTDSEVFKVPTDKPQDGTYMRFLSQPPIPSPRSTTEMRTNYTESGYDVDQDSCDQPIDYSMKYSETKTGEPVTETPLEKPKAVKKSKKDSPGNYGDYQETDLDQPTDYSLRYAEHQSETGSDISEPPGPSINEDTIKHFATEGTPYETPIIFSTATSMSDLRVIGKDGKPKTTPNVKENPEVMTHSDEKDTCSIEDPPRHDNDKALTGQNPVKESDNVQEKRSLFDTKFSSGMVSPEKPVNYCDEGTPGYFSRVSSLSSLGEPTEEDSLAKKNAMATINVDHNLQEQSAGSSAKDKEGSKAVTFATDPIEVSSQVATPGITSRSSPPPAGFVEDTPLMFSRSSSLGSLPDCDQPDDQGSVLSEVSRLTSGCISPSEIPDSPGHSVPLSPRARVQPPPPPLSPPPPQGPQSVFEERATTFLVENTPAHFSTATSLSSLTIDDDPKPTSQIRSESKPAIEEQVSGSRGNIRSNLDGDELRLPGQLPETPSQLPKSELKGVQTPTADSCKVYFTEDTPAILSKAGSNSNLSVLSILSAPTGVVETGAGREEPQGEVSSDSSNLSDANDVLEECIQKGIAQVVKNKGPPSEAGSVNQFITRDGPYRSLPPYLRSSTETVKMSHEFSRNMRDSRSASAERDGPPPLPPKPGQAPPPPAHPPRRHESRLPVKTQRNSMDRHRNSAIGDLTRNDSLSSLSIESFGSTDREIFEEVVKAGLSSINRVQMASDTSKGKAHSVERPSETTRHARHHKSLDRSDKIVQTRPKVKDPEFERNLAAGAYNIKPNNKFTNKNESRRGHSSRFDDGPPSLPTRIDSFSRKADRSNSLSSLSNESFGSTDKEVFERCVQVGMSKVSKKPDDKLRVRSDERLETREGRSRTKTSRLKRLEHEFGSLSLTRSPYSYHGETSTSSLAYHARSKAHRYHDDGPPSLPLETPRKLERSNSLSSLSNDSFGSTDKEVFERCVRMGMSKPQPKKDSKIRVRSDDRLEARDPHRRRHRTETKEKEEFAKERAILEEAIAKGEKACIQSKNVPVPSAVSAHAGGSGDPARTSPTRNGSDLELDASSHMDRSNECMAPQSANTTLESETRDELNRSNESYADVFNGSWSDCGSPKACDVATRKLEWTDIKTTLKPTDFDDIPKRSPDTWNDNTCPDDVTFPTISGSVHMVSSIKSEVVDGNSALPDLLEKSELASSFSRPDLTNRLERQLPENSAQVFSVTVNKTDDDKALLDSVPEPSFTSLMEEPKFDSIMSAAIEKEAARLAAQLKCSNYGMDTSVTSLNSLDLDNVKPPSNLGSLLSLSASGQWEDNSALVSKKTHKSRKKSLPVSLMVKRALSNSLHQGSSEHLDSSPMSFLENVKPPSEMEHIDMESSMLSVCSIVSEVADTRVKTPVVFDFKQPIQDFPMCNPLTNVFQDLDKVNPPSLFDEIGESTLEIEQTTAQQMYDDCISNTLNVVTDIPSGSENCTPLPSDISSVESTPKRQRYMTPKEKRQVAKDRYQTYTISDTTNENDVIIEAESEEFLTWTKSESDSRSDDYVTATSEVKSKRRLSAKQRRIEDRARYQTQTVDIQNILSQGPSHYKAVDPEIESLKQRLAAKKTMKQKRIEDAERFRTRTLSEDIPPSPTFVTKDANFENIETTTGYDSLSSNELSHQQISDERNDDVFRDVDSGNNEDDIELNSPQLQTYTKSFRNYLPVIESPAAVDMCVVNNLKNIEMTASYRRALQNDIKANPSSSDFASYEGDSNSEDKAQSDSESEMAAKPKPKIIKPDPKRDESLDSNESQDKEQDSPKPIRGRKKAMYVSPYRRNVPTKPIASTSGTKSVTKPILTKPTPVKASSSAKPPNRTTPSTSKAASANTSPKKVPPKSPSKIAQKAVSSPPAAKPLPLERQGTFTKEESTVPPKDLPVPDKKTSPRVTKSTPVKLNTSPSRLPQLNRYGRPQLRKTNSNDSKLVKKTPNRSSAPAMRNSASNHSLQSNDSGKTVTLTSRGSRQGSTSSVNSIPSAKTNAKDIESKIAGLWKRVEQTKKQPAKPDKRVWIEPEKQETPKLIRSSTFEGQPKQQVSTAPKQKTSIGIRVSQIPSLKPKTQSKVSQIPSTSKRPTTAKVFGRKQVNGQV